MTKAEDMAAAAEANRTNSSEAEANRASTAETSGRGIYPEAANIRAADEEGKSVTRSAARAAAADASMSEDSDAIRFNDEAEANRLNDEDKPKGHDFGVEFDDRRADLERQGNAQAKASAAAARQTALAKADAYYGEHPTRESLEAAYAEQDAAAERVSGKTTEPDLDASPESQARDSADADNVAERYE